MSVIASILRVLFYPLSLSLSIINRIAVYFGIRLPGSTYSGYRQLAADPASVADRWVRELEDETGAIRESRLFDVAAKGSATGAYPQAGPGPTTLSRRTESLRPFRTQIPEFYLGSYEGALKEAQKGMQLVCVVIVSAEHDDVPEFKRSTLTDPEFNKLLRDNNFLIWGGDVSDYEASQASQKLGATTYPFVAFIGLQPRRDSRGSINSPVLTVLSRHQGPSTPNDPYLPASNLGPTSARALHEHLSNSLLPRVSPFLVRLRTAHAERLMQRRLREEQDAAFARAAQADSERLAAKIAEERREREEFEMRELKLKQEIAEKQHEREEREAKEASRLHWYRYARRCLLQSEAAASAGKPGLVRIGVRLPDGRLQVRHFLTSDTITSLYIFVAVQLIPKDIPSSEDPDTPPKGILPGEAGITQESWSFTLALTYPRREVPWQASRTISSIDGLKGGGQLVIEGIQGCALIPGNGGHNQEENDDYDTEED